MAKVLMWRCKTMYKISRRQEEIRFGSVTFFSICKCAKMENITARAVQKWIVRGTVNYTVFHYEKIRRIMISDYALAIKKNKNNKIKFYRFFDDDNNIMVDAWRDETIRRSMDSIKQGRFEVIEKSIKQAIKPYKPQEIALFSDRHAIYYPEKKSIFWHDSKYPIIGHKHKSTKENWKKLLADGKDFEYFLKFFDYSLDEYASKINECS